MLSMYGGEELGVNEGVDFDIAATNLFGGEISAINNLI